jgi:NAD+ kinase
VKNPGDAPVAVVLKRSSWRKWVEEERDARILALVDAGDETVRRMRPGHVDHTETVEEVRRALATLGVEATWHEHPHGFQLPARRNRCRLVITVGGDGTLLGASHGIGPDVPLLGVNSSPNHSVGFFCAARKGSAGRAIAAALRGSLSTVTLSRMRVELNGRTLLSRVLNEALFCHASPAATSRYLLRVVRSDQSARSWARTPVIEEEDQKSSGLWVGPSAGSTAAQRSAGGRVLPLASRKVQYVVREPYRPWPIGASGPLAPRLTRGLIDEGEALTLRSKMRLAKLFLDGDHLAYDLSIGDVVTYRLSDEPLMVLGLGRRGSLGDGSATARPAPRRAASARPSRAARLAGAKSR